MSAKKREPAAQALAFGAGLLSGGIVIAILLVDDLRRRATT